MRLSDVDKDAMARALKIMLRHHESIYRTDFKRRLDEATEPWSKIGRHAASICQGEALGLKAWQVAPCEAEINTTDAPGYELRHTRKASALLGRLLAAGLSRFEPDVHAALDRAESARRDERVGDGTDSASPAPSP